MILKSVWSQEGFNIYVSDIKYFNRNESQSRSQSSAKFKLQKSYSVRRAILCVKNLQFKL